MPKLAAVLLLLLPLTGCLDLLSVHPLATPETAVADAALPGMWTSAESDADASALVRAIPGASAWDVIWIPRDTDEAPVRFRAALVRLNGRLILDLVRADRPDMGVSTHFFFLYQRDQDTLRLAWLDSEWLRAEATRPGVIPHTLSGTRPVLTAPPAALAAFFARTAADPRAVSDTLTLKRAQRAAP